MPLAVVAMAGRYADADDLPTAWDHLTAGESRVSHFPPQPASGSEITAESLGGRSFVCARAQLSETPLFHAAQFGIAPRIVALMDPQHQLVLDLVARAMGPGRYGLRERPEPAARVGVYVSVGAPSFLYERARARFAETKALDVEHLFMNNGADPLAGRVAQFLHATGPTLAVQETCVSALAALEVACWQLREGLCDMAVVAAAQVHAPRGQGYCAVPGGIWSTSGSTRPFSAGADGAVPGDGGGVLVLRREADVAGGCLGRIHGVGCARPGMDAGGLAALAQQVHDGCGLSPAAMDVMAAHGGGVRAGDALEVAAFVEAFRDRATPLPIVAHKGIWGHAGPASAMANVQAMLLAMLRGVIPPTCTSEDAEEAVLAATPRLTLTTEATPWPDTPGAVARTAAVTALGQGGVAGYAVLSGGHASAFEQEISRPVSALPTAGAATGLAVLPQVTEILGPGVVDAPDGTTLLALGLESFLEAELRVALADAHGVRLPEALVLKHHTLAGLDALVAAAPSQTAAETAWETVPVVDAAAIARLHRGLLTLPTEAYAFLDPLEGWNEGAERDLAGLTACLQDGLTVMAVFDGDALVAAFFAHVTSHLATLQGDAWTARPGAVHNYLLVMPDYRSRFSAMTHLEASVVTAPAFAALRAQGMVTAGSVRDEVWRSHARVLSRVFGETPRDVRCFLAEALEHERGPRLDAAYARLASEPLWVARLVAAIADARYGEIQGATLLALDGRDADATCDVLERLVSPAHAPVLHDARRRLRCGAWEFVGFDWRWMEPVFQWSR